MIKNTAGQKIGAQMVAAADGSAFTSSVTVYVTGDAGTQAVGSVSSGACTHEGNGYHTYAPAQAETNYDLIAFTFIGTGAIPATIQVETLSTTDYTAIADAVVTELGDTTFLTLEEIADALHAEVVGSGSDQCTMQILVSGVPQQGAEVWITTDEAGTNTVAGPVFTDSSGNATFLLTAGDTYFLWARKDGMDPITGGDSNSEFVAVAD